MLEYVIQSTKEFLDEMPKEKRKKIGQFFTSKETAIFMASLFDLNNIPDSISILDPGSGTGILATALIQRILQYNKIRKVTLVCYENNPDVIPVLEGNMRYIMKNVNLDFDYEIREEDYLLSQSHDFEEDVLANKNLQKYDVADKYIPGIRKECAGGPEEWLEFTSNFDLALFYACCKWDEEQLEWLPMTEADIERPYGEGEPDPHYGVIYMANAEDARFFGTYANAPEYHIMTPAGSLVDGGNREYIFAMRMRDKDELQKDARFDILVFEHTEKFCQDVYELMQKSLPTGSAVFKKI